MASKSKPRGTRRSSTQAKKPATIDLNAKEVKTAAEETAKAATTAAKDSTTSTTANKAADTAANKTENKANFGRPDTSAKTPDKISGNKRAEPKPTVKAETKKSEDKAANKPASSPAQQPVKSSGSFFGKLTSAFMGGVAALVGFGAIGLWEGARELPIIGSFYGGSQSSSVNVAEFDALKAELAALKQEVATPKVDLTPLNEKITALETNIATISSATEANADTSEIDGKLAKLQEEFAGVNTTVSDMNTAVAEMTASATDGNNSSPIALSTAITSLDGRLEKLEADTVNISKSVSKNPALDAINSSLETIEQDIQGVKDNVKGISDSVTTLQDAGKTNAQTLAGLTEQSATFEKTVESVKAGEKVAKSVAVNALGTALDNDDALALPISSVKSLIGETPEIKRFEELVNQGIPSKNELSGSLDAIINTVQNPNAPSKDGSIADRFWANAQNMVSFRTSGPQEGNTPLAILSRVKANVEEDRLAKAKAEWDTLPTDLRESNASWISKLNARIEAFGLHEALNQKLTAEAG